MQRLDTIGLMLSGKYPRLREPLLEKLWLNSGTCLWSLDHSPAKANLAEARGAGPGSHFSCVS